LQQAQALWGVPQFAPGDDALLRDNRCDFIGLNYYRRETVSARPQEGLSAVNRASKVCFISCVTRRAPIPNGAGRFGRRG
jgi:beta-glucosidase/6-phospho-beta-glucosidase/beta-galactosidase